MHTIAAPWLGVVLAPALAAQMPPLPAGYQVDVTYVAASGGFALRGCAAGANGKLWLGEHGNLVEVDELGFPAVIHAFPAGSGIGLLAHFAGTDDLYFTQEGTTVLWHRSVSSGAEVAGKVPAFAFDLARAPTGELLVSANPKWPSPSATAGIWGVDFAGGNHREIVMLTGPSGPLAFDSQGNLYYAMQSSIYPTPPGSVSVVRFDRSLVQAVLAGAPPLTLADATSVLSNLDGAYDIAFDDRDRLYVTDPQKGGVVRTEPNAGSLASEPLLQKPQAPDTTVTTQLAFADGGTAATFDPHQPSGGGAMYVQATDWSLRAEIWRVRPQRPAVISSPTSRASRGPVTFFLSDLPPNGVAWLCGSPLPAVPERALFAWNGTPFWSALDPAVEPVCMQLATDGNGRAQVVVQYGGGANGTASFQALGIESFATAWPFGTSPVYALTLLP
jgi:hypothetical protein